MIPRVVRGPLVVPGHYTVRLTAAGRTLTAPLTVLADPHSLGTPATLEAEHQFQATLVEEIDRVSDMIEHLEWTRKQLETIVMRYEHDPAQQAVVEAAKKLEDRAIAVEGQLIDVYLTDGNEDLNRHPSELYQKLTALYDKDEADEGPTAADLAVNTDFRQWMDKSETALRQFEQTDVSHFNDLLKTHHLAMTIQPA